MSTVLKKGAPSRSYPSRQRKLGPAPFASFEDLSDELESPADGQHGAEGHKVEVMPEIREQDMPHSPSAVTQKTADEEVEHHQRPHKSVTATSSASTVTFAPSYSAPTSGPTSGLQTPSTPRIDISCASSSTPPSEDSCASEKELFQGGLGFAFHEEGTEELRSSTEELELGEIEIDSEEERRQKRKQNEEEIYRRSSHPANIFSRRKSSTAVVAPDHDEDAQRKPSAHSLFLDGLLSRPSCRHASFGSADYGRPGALSSLSAHSSGSVRGRSPSPHKMMLETSFCGNKPIPTKSIDIESPPKEKEITPKQKEIPPKLEGLRAISPGPAPLLSTEPKSPRSPRSPRDFDSRRPSSTSGRRSVSPFKLVYETSFCGSKPIPTRSLEQEFPPQDPAELGNGNPFSLDILKTTLTTSVQIHNPIVNHQSPSPLTSPDFDNRNHRATSPESPKSSDHWRPLSPRIGTPSPTVGTPATGRNSSSSSSTFMARTGSSSSTPMVESQTSQLFNRRPDTNIFKWPETPSPLSKPEKKTPTDAKMTTYAENEEMGEGTSSSKSSGKIVSGSDSHSNEFKQHHHQEVLESDEITTEMKISEDPVVTVEDALPIESKGLFFMNDSFDEDGDLPYVPTTLPQEKSSVVPIFPSKERRSMSVTTTPVQRPRVNRPPNPASIHDYIAYSSVPKMTDEEVKMKINLPREDSVTESNPGKVKSPRKKSASATSWTDFAELGLRSPRDIRRKLREENGAIDDLSSYHSDSSEAVGGQLNGSDDEGESLLKLPKVPFEMDLDVKSNRSSAMSQEVSPVSPSVSSLPLEEPPKDSNINQQD